MLVLKIVLELALRPTTTRVLPLVLALLLVLKLVLAGVFTLALVEPGSSKIALPFSVERAKLASPRTEGCGTRRDEGT